MLEILDKYNNALRAVSIFALPAAHLTYLVVLGTSFRNHIIFIKSIMINPANQFQNLMSGGPYGSGPKIGGIFEWVYLAHIEHLAR